MVSFLLFFNILLIIFLVGVGFFAISLMHHLKGKKAKVFFVLGILLMVFCLCFGFLLEEIEETNCEVVNSVPLRYMGNDTFYPMHTLGVNMPFEVKEIYLDRDNGFFDYEPARFFVCENNSDARIDVCISSWIWRVNGILVEYEKEIKQVYLPDNESKVFKMI